MPDRAALAIAPRFTRAVHIRRDFRDLRYRLKVLGARTAGCAWLIGRLDRPSRKASASIGNSRPPHQAKAASRAPDAEDDERSGWQTGRGATTKKGNPKRAPKGSSGASDRSAG